MTQHARKSTWWHVVAGTSRRGSVLLVVLVIVVLLALGAYTFSETMISEHQAAAMHGRQVASRALAESGVQFVAATLGQRGRLVNESVLDNPHRFRNVLVTDADTPQARGRFSVVAARPDDPTFQLVRFGVQDESSKLNLNTLLVRVRDDRLDEVQARALLLGVPRMTPETADAVLDWLDDDDVPRQFGAETEFYSRLDPSYRARNGLLDSLADLLAVRGITAELLFGEDANENGLLDANENDGPRTAPPDNADNVLDRGWQAYLTVHSREANLRRDGRPRINVNETSLPRLFRQLQDAYGDDVAAFVVAFRTSGQDLPPADEADQASGNHLESVTGKTRIQSVYDLIGTEVPAATSRGVAFRSPWSASPDKLREYLPELLDALTTRAEPYLEGRININLAARPVLGTVPGMTDRLMDTILAAQWGSLPDPVAAAGDPRATTAWLLLDGHVDLAQMQQLDRYITARGDVYRAQVIGYFDAGATATRLEAIVDATYRQPRVISLRDLTPLGSGFSRPQLLSQGSTR